MPLTDPASSPFATALALLALGAPALLLLAGLVPATLADRRPALVARLAEAAAWLAFAAALAGGALLATGTGAVAHEFAGLALVGDVRLALGVRVDTLTLVMWLLVAFVGAIVVRYSRRYLDGDARHGRFTRWLARTLAAVLTLIVAGNLALLAAAWIATSLCLHRLLVHYRERPGAQLAARKKFVLSRLGDAALLGAVAVAGATFGTLEYDGLFAAAEPLRAAGEIPLAAHALAALLVASAVLKSAQFPFHGWLPEVMETPTPVSALLHAGIINAGGFLIVRLSPLVSLSAPSLDVLAVIGAVTALFGALVMLTQTSVKVSLAWSTVAQMGFMLLQCGLGSYASAVLHIVAHSLYKAHSFLSSGSVIELAKAAWVPASRGHARPVTLALALLAAVALVALVGRAFGVHVTEQPGVVVLGAIFAMGVVHLVWTAASDHPPAAVVARGAALALLAAASWFALQVATHALLAGSVAPDRVTADPVALGLSVAVTAAFLIMLLIQELLPHRATDPRWQSAYVHVHNGLYLDALANRWLQSTWPVRVATSAPGAIR
jgi:NAD(P)H-quinone oxidoreductase subunit 5